MSQEVVCIRKNDSSTYDDCRCIELLGTRDGNSYRREDAYWKVRGNEKALYIRANNGTRVYLVAVKRGDVRYVRTEANDTEADNLLSLPECK